MAVRRFAAMPSAAIIAALSGVVIVDSPPPAPAQQAAFGKICLVAEFEDGPFITPTDLLQSTDQADIFGLFGFQYGSAKYQYACAVASGGTEPFNGNGWVQSKGLVFGGGLTFCRVDTSIGAVSFTPRAFLDSTLTGPFNITPGLTFIYNPSGAGNVTVTFAGTAASSTASAGTYDSFVGGETLTLAFDSGANVVITFQPGDNTLSAIISRINTVLGAVYASNASSQLKLTSLTYGTGSKVTVVAGSAATTLGLTAATTSGSGDAVNLAAMTQAEFITKVSTGSMVPKASPTGLLRLVILAGGSGSIVIGSGTANAALGFTAGATASAALTAAVSIAAGTRCSDDGATRVVTMQTTALAAGFAGTVNLKVRPAVDDGSYPGVSGGTITTLEDQPGNVEWSITNTLSLTAALTASQLDSAYLAAIAATVGPGNDTTKKIYGIVSARSSAAIDAAIVQNAITCAANGHYDRRGFVCTKNGSTAAEILSYVASYRAEEVSLAAGGVTCVYQEMIDGGYSTDGVMVRHPDVMLASRWGSLTPGYNPGQLPEEPTLQWSQAVFTGVEPAAQGWDNATYAAFKQAGVCAVVFDKDLGITFEQGITTVDPNIDSSRARIARRTLAGVIGDSFANVAKIEVKRQATALRIDNLIVKLESIVEPMVGDTIVAGYILKSTTSGLPPNTTRFDFLAQEVGSLDDIIFALTVGPNAVTLTRG